MKPATWIPTFVGMTELFNDINRCILQFLVFWTTVLGFGLLSCAGSNETYPDSGIPSETASNDDEESESAFLTNSNSDHESDSAKDIGDSNQDSVESDIIQDSESESINAIDRETEQDSEPGSETLSSMIHETDSDIRAQPDTAEATTTRAGDDTEENTVIISETDSKTDTNGDLSNESTSMTDSTSDTETETETETDTDPILVSDSETSPTTISETETVTPQETAVKTDTTLHLETDTTPYVETDTTPHLETDTLEETSTDTEVSCDPNDYGVCPDGTCVGTYCFSFLDEHNGVREAVNEGTFLSQPQAVPPIEMMQWDPLIAQKAQAYADSVIHWDDGHSSSEYRTYSSTWHDGYHGENMALGSNTAIEIVRQRWCENEANNCILNECGGHYTQVVWRESTGLGCGWKEDIPFEYNGTTYYGRLTVCQYGPGGNINNRAPY